VLTPLTSTLVPERELSPETQPLCGPPPGRNKGAGTASAALRLFGASMLFSRRHRPPTFVGPSRDSQRRGCRLDAAILLLTLCDEAIGFGDAAILLLTLCDEAIGFG
jgi:hypothetical protein